MRHSTPRRSHPVQPGTDRFGPPTLERSDSEHRRASPSLLRFLSPYKGNQMGIKTIEERVGVRGGTFFNGKEERIACLNGFLLS